MEFYFFVILLVAPYAYGADTLYGYPVYDPAKEECQIVHGGFTEWSCFGPCSVSCGKGIQKRYRHCTAPVPKYGGNKCSGDHVQVKECDTKLACPVDGGWSAHVKSPCSKSCGGGVVTYTRECNNPPKSKCGKDCVGASRRTEACNTHKCPVHGPWQCGKCQRQQGRCVRKCTRQCLYHKNDRNYCSGPLTETRPCAPQQCTQDTDPKGLCYSCHQEAITKSNGPKYPADFVGLACRATNLADYCKNNAQTPNGGLPANHWFWIHCSPDGPWCKPCATRGLVFNKKCDACEETADGPCTGVKAGKRDVFDDENDDDFWKK